MAEKQLNLFQSACGRLRVSRMGGLTMLVIDGQGMALAPTADFSVVEKWAKSRPSGPNATIDAGICNHDVQVSVTLDRCGHNGRNVAFYYRVPLKRADAGVTNYGRNVRCNDTGPFRRE